MKDILEFWMLVWFFDSMRYVLGVGSVALVLYVFCRPFSEDRRIQQRTASRADLEREIKYSFLTTAVYATVALLTVYLERQDIIVHYSGGEYSFWYTTISLPLILVLHDTYFYWVHRLMHWKPLFRLAHVLHHRSRTPTSWAAYAFAPGEAFLMALFLPLFGLAFPLHESVLFLFLAIMILRNAMGHSGVEFHPQWWVDSPLDIFTSVTHHDLHHQRNHGNYGLYFTWWDRLMGTEFDDYKERFREAAGGKPDAKFMQQQNRTFRRTSAN